MRKRVNREVFPLPKLDKSEWGKRRFRLDIALVFIMVMIGWIIFKGSDTAVYQQAILALIAAGVALLGQYIFGAAWDDKNYMRTLAQMHRDRCEMSDSGNSDDMGNTESIGEPVSQIPNEGQE